MTTPPKKIHAKKPAPSNKISQKTSEVLKSLGISPAEIRRETNPDVMIPKMALIGIFRNLSKFCDLGTEKIQNTIGPMDVAKIRAYLNAMDATIGLADITLAQYEANQANLVLRDLAKGVGGPEQEEEGEIQVVGDDSLDPHPEEHRAAPPAEEEKERNTSVDAQDEDEEEDDFLSGFSPTGKTGKKKSGGLN